MKYFLEFFIVLFFSIFTLASLFFELAWIGDLLSIIGIFIIPGWLLTQILVEDNDKPDVTRFILIFTLGAVLVTLEAFSLVILNINITREFITLASLIVSWFLLATLVFRQQMTSDDLDNSIKKSVLTISVAIITAVILILFISLHQPIAQENYTEFYVIPRLSGQMEVFIVNHEQNPHTYILTCKDNTAPEVLLAIFLLEPGSRQRLDMDSSLLQSDLANKMRLNLYLDEVTVPYHWLEVIGTSCNQLPVE
ncbi:MAG: hypothetical protein JW953_11970 [Anaerolineae bacterium]|nr:hypothetical protein [Anaerolineae bacterium]